MSFDAIRIAVAASALGDDPRQTPRQAHQLGFQGLQFDAYTASLEIPTLSGSGRREFRLMLSSADQQLAGFRADLGPKGLGLGADVDRILSRLDSALEAAAALSSPLVCVELGPLPAPARENKPKPRVTPEQAGLLILPTSRATEPTVEPAGPPPDPAFVSQVDAALNELGRRADRYSVMVAFRSDLASLAALDRAVRAAACPWFGIDLDPVSILRDEWDADEAFSRLGSFIRHVRGRDAVAGADRRTRPSVIGAGGTDWGKLLANLDAADYHGWISVDPMELTDRIGGASAGRKALLAAMV